MTAHHRGAKVVLITGATTGIGAATARCLLAAGHRVVITGRDQHRVAAAAATLGGPDKVVAVQADPTAHEAMVAAVELALGTFGQLDAVIPNAGFSTNDTVATGDPTRWREMLLTNVMGPLVLIKAALPALKQTRGRILLMGSVAGLKNTPGNVYSVTKWAITGLAENTRMLVGADGIGVTLLAPGRVDTPFWAHHDPDHPMAGPALTADDVGRCAAWVIDQPTGVDINTVTIRPTGQTV